MFSRRGDTVCDRRTPPLILEPSNSEGNCASSRGALRTDKSRDSAVSRSISRRRIPDHRLSLTAVHGRHPSCQSTCIYVHVGNTPRQVARRCTYMYFTYFTPTSRNSCDLSTRPIVHVRVHRGTCICPQDHSMKSISD